MVKSKLVQKEAEIKHLDEATQTIIRRIDNNDRRLRFWAFMTLVILLSVGLIGIYRQNQLANQNKTHIDCIVKLLATPTTSGQTRQITSLSSCHIKVSG